jgi:hypothetical protein
VVAVMSEVRTKNRNGVPAEVHALLVMWGNYRRRTKVGPQGYPKESPFVKAALYGKLGIPQESNVRIDDDSMPALVEWIDRIVVEMPEDLQKIIDTRYKPPVNEYGNEPPFEMMAKSLYMSPSTFRSRLESAQWYVYARMYP